MASGSARLAERATVVTSDLRGCGDSNKPPSAADHEPYSLRAIGGDQLEDVARRRIADRPVNDRIARHLQARYGISVSGLTEIDLGVYRVDRADDPAGVARVLPADRAEPG